MAKQQVVNLPFPIKGINRDTGHDVLPDRQTQTMLNVRPHDSIQGRARGGSRPSIAKWFDTQIADGFMQALEKGAVQKSSLEVSSSSYYVQGSPGVELTYNTIDITTGETIASVGLDGTDSTSVLIGSAPGIALSLRSGRTILQAHMTDFPYSRLWGHQLNSLIYDNREIASVAVDAARDRVYVVYDNQPLLTALRLSDGRKQWEVATAGPGDHPNFPRQNRVRVAPDTGAVYVASKQPDPYTCLSGTFEVQNGSSDSFNQWTTTDTGDFSFPITLDSDWDNDTNTFTDLDWILIPRSELEPYINTGVDFRAEIANFSTTATDVAIVFAATDGELLDGSSSGFPLSSTTAPGDTDEITGNGTQTGTISAGNLDTILNGSTGDDAENRPFVAVYISAQEISSSTTSLDLNSLCFKPPDGVVYTNSSPRIGTTESFDSTLVIPFGRFTYDDTPSAPGTFTDTTQPDISSVITDVFGADAVSSDAAVFAVSVAEITGLSSGSDYDIGAAVFTVTRTGGTDTDGPMALGVYLCVVRPGGVTYISAPDDDQTIGFTDEGLAASTEEEIIIPLFLESDEVDALQAAINDIPDATEAGVMVVCGAHPDPTTGDPATANVSATFVSHTAP